MQEKAGVVVSVVMGSDSDLPVMEETVKVLEAFAIPHELFLTSAHRTPERTAAFCRGAAKRGVRVIIVGAGAAAHLAGVIASQTLLPVIGVPIDATSLQGLDALLATVQMPGDPRRNDGHRQGGGEECRAVRRPDFGPGGCRSSEEAPVLCPEDGPGGRTEARKPEEMIWPSC